MKQEKQGQHLISTVTQYASVDIAALLPVSNGYVDFNVRFCGTRCE